MESTTDVRREPEAGLSGVDGIRRQLWDAGCETRSVRDARDHFPDLVKEARSGRIQLVGLSDREQVAVIALADLSRMLGNVARGATVEEAIRRTARRPGGRR